MNKLTKFATAIVVTLTSLTFSIAGADAAPAEPKIATAPKALYLNFAEAEPINEVPITTSQVGENCRNIGNGDVCIRIGDINNLTADVTVWFNKRAGDPVSVRLRYSGGSGQEDEGAFTISAGQVRGYIWRNQFLTDSCYYGQLRTGPPSYMNLIYGGVVCI